jgi:hypothetical protein
LRIRWDGLSLLAYGISGSFIAAGLLALAGGDAHIGSNRLIHHPSDMVGDDRHLFGVLLMAGGYVLMRWVFRRQDAERRLAVELRIVAGLALLGYVAYCIGG